MIKEGVMVIIGKDGMEYFGIFDADHIEEARKEYIGDNIGIAHTPVYKRIDNVCYDLIFNNDEQGGSDNLTVLIGPNVDGGYGRAVRGNVIIASGYDKERNKIVPLVKNELIDLIKGFDFEYDDFVLLRSNINDFPISYPIM